MLSAGHRTQKYVGCRGNVRTTAEEDAKANYCTMPRVVLRPQPTVAMHAQACSAKVELKGSALAMTGSVVLWEASLKS